MKQDRHRPTWSPTLPLLALAFAMLAGPAGATTVARFDIEDLTHNAACVFVGTCVQSEVSSIEGQLYTKYQFAVSEIIKGGDPDQRRIEVLLPGGEMGGRMQRIAGMPEFVPGTETVFFLTEHNAAGHAWPVGLSQGAFFVRREPGRNGAQGPAIVYSRISELNLLNTLDGVSAAKSSMHPPSTPLIDGMALDDFLSRVRSILNEPGSADGSSQGTSAR